MSNNFFQKKLIIAGARLSLCLVDALEARKYDYYIYQFLNNYLISYQKYTLLFGLDYNDETQEFWQVLVLSKENQWDLVEIPNAFYKGKLNESIYNSRREFYTSDNFGTHS